MELTETELNMLVFMYSNQVHKLEPQDLDPVTIFPEVEKLVGLGFIVVMRQQSECRGSVWYSVGISPSGRAYVFSRDPVIVTHSFIHLKYWFYATNWIRAYVPVERLPEFLAHKELVIRRAAREKLTGNYSNLVLPYGTYKQTSNRTHSV